jgi:hypothetical protein
MEIQEENEELNFNDQQERAPEHDSTEVTGDPPENVKVDNVNLNEDTIGYANVDDLLEQIDNKDANSDDNNSDIVDNDLNTDNKSMGLDSDADFLK